MTKNIRREAPEGAEYFKSCGMCTDYYRVDEEEQAHKWSNGKWNLMPWLHYSHLTMRNGYHALEASSIVMKYFYLIYIVALALSVIYFGAGQ